MSKTANIVRDVLTLDPTISAERIDDTIAVLTGQKKAVDVTDHEEIEQAYTSQQVAKLLGVTVQALKHHVRVGHIVRISNGKYSAESVRAFMAGRRAA